MDLAVSVDATNVKKSVKRDNTGHSLLERSLSFGDMRRDVVTLQSAIFFLLQSDRTT